MAASSYIGPERRWTPSFLALSSFAVPYVERDDAIRTIGRSLVDGSQIRVAFCNANMMLLALRDEDYARAMQDFLVLNDGVGIDLASRMLKGRPFDHNLNGTDFVPDFLAQCPADLSIYLLGAKPEVVAGAARHLEAAHPRHAVVGTRDGFFGEDEVESVLAEINAAAPDLVLVAMGNPLQELFIHRHADRLDARIVMGVGALFDFMAGSVPRAPRWMRQLRLEWLFRLMNEPIRLARRYTVDLAAFLAKIAWLRLMQDGEPSPLPRSRLRPGP